MDGYHEILQWCTMYHFLLKFIATGGFVCTNTVTEKAGRQAGAEHKLRLLLLVCILMSEERIIWK